MSVAGYTALAAERSGADMNSCVSVLINTYDALSEFSGKAHDQVIREVLDDILFLQQHTGLESQRIPEEFFTRPEWDSGEPEGWTTRLAPSSFLLDPAFEERRRAQRYDEQMKSIEIANEYRIREIVELLHNGKWDEAVEKYRANSVSNNLARAFGLPERTEKERRESALAQVKKIAEQHGIAELIPATPKKAWWQFWK
jgi:hypothetical protein